MACRFPVCPGSSPGSCISCADSTYDQPKVRQEPYAEQRKAEAGPQRPLNSFAHPLESMAKELGNYPKSRSVSIAITHLQEAAMWLNRAHYKKD